MKKVCIYLYSGTGMTKYVINKMKAEFENQQIDIDIFNIEDTKAQDVSFSGYDGIGFAYPVHSFNAPEIVVKFARLLPRTENINTFIISTAGGESSTNFASSDLLIKTLQKKGFSVFYNRQFIMPSNFIVQDNIALVIEKLEKADIEAPKAALEIINHISHAMQGSSFAKVVAFLGRAEWFGTKCFKFFYADKKICNRCGLCARKCPNRSIILGKHSALFKRKCGLCMRCLYLCPQGAIKTRRLFKFMGFKVWYGHGDLSVRKNFADEEKRQ